MKKYLLVTVVLFCITILGATIGCQLFKPTPAGGCPPLTVDLFAGSSYAGGTAALAAGAPVSILSAISSNIEAAIATGEFKADLVNIAIANSGGAQWAKYLGGISLLFSSQFNTLVNSNLNAQVCAVPCANAVVLGLNTAIATAPPVLLKAGIKDAKAGAPRSDPLVMLRDGLRAFKN